MAPIVIIFLSLSFPVLLLSSAGPAAQSCFGVLRFAPDPSLFSFPIGENSRSKCLSDSEGASVVSPCASRSGTPERAKRSGGRGEDRSEARRLGFRPLLFYHAMFIPPLSRSLPSYGTVVYVLRNWLASWSASCLASLSLWSRGTIHGWLDDARWH